MAHVVTSCEEVENNIRAYLKSLADDPRLVERMSYHRAWYAVRSPAGNWQFGPSKFIGYRDADTARYVATYDRKDGRETEPVLASWFEPVDPGTALGKELRAAFERLAAAYGKSPNSRWRVSVPRSAVPWSVPNPDLTDRIAFDPDILGGRPHIRGTRVGVSHILAALAAGDTADELVNELPYLTHEDIQAALQYAAQNIDHPVLVAA